MALATATPDGVPRCGWCCSRAMAPTASSSTPMRTAARAAKLRPIPGGPAVSLEVAAPPDPHRGPLGEVDAATADAYFASRVARFAARRGGVRPVLAAGRARRLCWTGMPRRSSALPAREVERPPPLDRIPPAARAPSNSGSTAPHRLHERRRFVARRRAAGPARCSIHDRARQSPAALNRSAAFASIAVAALLVGLKGWAAWSTGSTAMLGSLADTALDLVASLATLAGVWVAAQPDDAKHRFGHGKAEALAAMFQVVLISISALGLAFARGRADAWRRAHRGGGRGHCRLADRHGGDAGAAGLAAPCHPPHRQPRHCHRPCPLPVGPAAQPRGDRGAGARSIWRHRRGRSGVRPGHRRCGSAGAPGARRTRRSNS